MESYTVLLTYRLFKARFKIAFGQAMRDDFLVWRTKPGRSQLCWICHHVVRRKEISMDHLIPVSICFMINKPELIVDPRNWAIAHIKCNGKRGTNLSLLPEAVRIHVESLILAAAQD